MRFGDDFHAHYESGDEHNDPHYRVSFWSGTAEEWIDIHEADVGEVLEWVRAHADGRPFTLWARIRLRTWNQPDEVVDVRLHGVDPTRVDEDYPPWAAGISATTTDHPSSATRSAYGRPKDMPTS
jgi:hypothetical protein